MRFVPLFVLIVLAGVLGSIDTLIGLVGGVASTWLAMNRRRDTFGEIEPPAFKHRSVMDHIRPCDLDWERYEEDIDED